LIYYNIELNPYHISMECKIQCFKSRTGLADSIGNRPSSQSNKAIKSERQESTQRLLKLKWHFFEIDRGLEDYAYFSRPRLNLSWGCWWDFKSMVKVLELSKNFPKSFVRKVISSLNFLNSEDLLVLLGLT